MNEFIKSTTFLLMLLNPFLVIVYLIDVVQKLDKKQFNRVLLHAGLLSAAVFCVFAILGDAVFAEILQAQFASFQIFGGIIFLLIGTQFVFQGPAAIEILRGESKHIAGAIAMPVLIGPGTISASVVVGKRLEPLAACSAVIISVILCLVTIALLKSLHDYVRPRKETLIERYMKLLAE
jgi:multiple antibiotic resistance protein